VEALYDAAVERVQDAPQSEQKPLLYFEQDFSETPDTTTLEAEREYLLSIGQILRALRDMRTVDVRGLTSPKRARCRLTLAKMENGAEAALLQLRDHLRHTRTGPRLREFLMVDEPQPGGNDRRCDREPTASSKRERTRPRYPPRRCNENPKVLDRCLPAGDAGPMPLPALLRRRPWLVLPAAAGALVLTWVAWRGPSPVGRGCRLTDFDYLMVPVGTTPDDLDEALRLRRTGDTPAMDRMVDDGRLLPVETGTHAVVRGRPLWPMGVLRGDLLDGRYAGRVGYVREGAAKFGS
jgi:hypothetical protein